MAVESKASSGKTLLPKILPTWLPGAALINEVFDSPEGTPRPTVSLRSALLVGADEALLVGLGLASRIRFPTPGFRQRSAKEMEDALEYFQASGWLDDPRTYHQKPPALEKVSFKNSSSGGTSFEHMTFESGYVPRMGEAGRARWLGYESNHTSHCWVLRHAGPPRPWMIHIHGYRMGTPYLDFKAFSTQYIHQTKGFNVLHYVIPLHGPRKIGPTSGDGLLSPGYVNAIHAEAQAMFELRRIIDWLRRDGAEQIGVHGISLGGFTTALLATLEGNLSCVIAGIPAVELVKAARRLGRRNLLYFFDNLNMPWDEIEKMAQVISPTAMKVKVPKKRRFIYAGVLDRLVHPAEPLGLWEHWDRPAIEWYQGNHMTFARDKNVRTFIDNALDASFT
ncbi:MAG: hypothetical protein P1U52_01515 [Porticoccaceae bacterium]|nr:hypothetical protein [Porticoccaceae bacterium]